MGRARIAMAVIVAAVLHGPLAGQTAPLAEKDLVARLGSVLDSLSAADEFSGVVVLARGDSRVFARAYGYADREKRLPNRLDTGFNLGSIN